jgi:methyltransferase (TIGR00027 family)
MIEGQFSRTALVAAGLRAAHQIVDGASVFADPLASVVLGDDLPALMARCADPVLRPLRLFVALRSRIAEDVAHRAIAEGALQVVVLGAGLDTFAWRVPPLRGLRVFEVDHPATQAEKRRRLAAPAHLAFAPCDFERQTLRDALAAAGFDANARAAFLWLGVTPYLTREAAEATLRFVAGVAQADIVFDYANPPASIDSPGQRLFHETMAARVAELGEAFRCYFETADLHRLLSGLGFAEIVDLGPAEIARRLDPGAPAGSESGGHILHASFRRA